ncbi:MAG TPA: DUF202 domain-containing protein [Nannocystis sp.]
MPDETCPPGQLQARLANERTLLAWLRTAVSLMGFGVMIARLGVFLDALARSSGAHAVAAGQSRWTGAALLLTGSAVALVGRARTRAYATLVATDGRPPRDHSLDFTALLVAALGVVLSLGVVFMD